MEKSYLQSTLSSKSKTRNQIQMKSTTSNISKQIKHLKTSIDTEENISKQTDNSSYNGKDNENLNNQMTVLKGAFNTLADTIVEEMDKMKREMTLDIGDRFDRLMERMDGLETDQLNSKEFFSKKIMEASDKNRREILDVYAIIDGGRNDNKRLFEHLKNIILNTDQQITHLKAEQDTVLKDFESFKENSEKDYENNIKINQKLINIEKDLSLGFKEKQNELFDITNNISQISNNLQLEKGITTKQTNDISSITNELSILTKSFKTLSITIEGDLLKNKEIMEQELYDLKLNIEGKVMHSLGDFGGKVGDIEHRMKLIERKSDTIEELMTTQRKELFASLSELELALLRKQDKLARCIRNIDLPQRSSISMLNSPT